MFKVNSYAWKKLLRKQLPTLAFKETVRKNGAVYAVETHKYFLNW